MLHVKPLYRIKIPDVLNHDFFKDIRGSEEFAPIPGLDCVSSPLMFTSACPYQNARLRRRSTEIRTPFIRYRSADAPGYGVSNAMQIDKSGNDVSSARSSLSSFSVDDVAIDTLSDRLAAPRAASPRAHRAAMLPPPSSLIETITYRMQPPVVPTSDAAARKQNPYDISSVLPGSKRIPDAVFNYGKPRKAAK